MSFITFVKAQLCVIVCGVMGWETIIDEAYHEAIDIINKNKGK